MHKPERSELFVGLHRAVAHSLLRKFMEHHPHATFARHHRPTVGLITGLRNDTARERPNRQRFGHRGKHADRGRTDRIGPDWPPQGNLDPTDRAWAASGGRAGVSGRARFRANGPRRQFAPWHRGGAIPTACRSTGRAGLPIGAHRQARHVRIRGCHFGPERCDDRKLWRRSSCLDSRHQEAAASFPLGTARAGWSPWPPWRASRTPAG